MNFDLKVYADDKTKIAKIRKERRTTFTVIIKSILTYYSSLPVEDLAKTILSEQYLKGIPKKTITIKESIISKETDHLRKVYEAVLTKKPRLEFKGMLCLLIHHFITNNTFDQSTQ